MRLREIIALIVGEARLPLPVCRGLVLAIRDVAVARGDTELLTDCETDLAKIDHEANRPIRDDVAATVMAQLEGVLRAIAEGRPPPPTDDADVDAIMQFASFEMPPRAALGRVLAGQGSPTDLGVVRFYIGMLEQQARGSHGEPRSIEPGRVVTVGQHYFSPPDAVDGSSNRIFIVTVSRDRTAMWTDEQGREEARNDRLLAIKALMGDSASRRTLVREQEEFSVESSISEEAYRLLVEKSAIMAQGWEIPDDLEDAIDSALAPNFWADVNPFLPSPLRRRGV